MTQSDHANASPKRKLATPSQREEDRTSSDLEALFNQHIKTTIVRKLKDEKNFYVKIYGIDSFITEVENLLVKSRIDELEKHLLDKLSKIIKEDVGRYGDGEIAYHREEAFIPVSKLYAFLADNRKAQLSKKETE